MKLNSAFHRLFLLREGKEILGKRLLNLLVVFIILLATFFALGLSNGSTNYLNKKMDNPFNNWVNFRTTNIKPKDLDTLIYCIKEKANDFHIKTLDTLYYKGRYFYFGPKAEKKKGIESTQIMYGLTLNQNSSLLNFLINKSEFKNNCKNYNSIKNDFDNVHGVIVKRKMLERLGYEKVPEYLKYFLGSAKYKCKNCYASIPVLGVVEDLPLNVSFIYNVSTFKYLEHKGYIKILNEYYHESIVDLVNGRDVQLYLDNEIDFENVNQSIGNNLQHLSDSIFHESVFTNGKYYNLSDSINLNYLTKKLLNYSYSNEIHLVHDIDRLNNFRTKEFSDNITFVSIFLSDLDQIRELKKFLDDFPSEHGFDNSNERIINIDISSVESLENLHFISELTKVLSIFLLLFSMFSIILFLVNIINAHFEKIKQNIGTLKAFGLSNQKLIGNYIFIYMLIIFSASLFAFYIANLMGQSGMAVFIFNLLDITIEKGETCFHLFNMKGLGAFVIILILAMGVVYYKLLKILRSTPGDLIFER